MWGDDPCIRLPLSLIFCLPTIQQGSFAVLKEYTSIVISMNADESTDHLPPPPDDPDPDEGTEGRRLWVGNLDTRLTEFSLVKVLQKFGSLDKFDFIYHKTGPNTGKPRGYCFVTYKTIQEAENAMKALDGKLALSKRLVVKKANMNRAETMQKRLGASILGKDTPPLLEGSRSAQIQAIETKLRLMERNPDPASTALSGSSSSPSRSGGVTGSRGYSQSGSSHSANRGYGPSTHSDSHRRHMPYDKSKPR